MLGNSVEKLGPMRPLTPTAPLRMPLGCPEPPASAKPAICQLCTPGYERELAKLFSDQFEKAAAAPPRPEPSKAIPHWLKPGADQQPKDQELKWKQSTAELENKWRETCSKLHPRHADKPAIPALSMPFAAFGPPKLALNISTPAVPNLKLAPVLKATALNMSTPAALASPKPTPVLKTTAHWEKPGTYTSPELRKSPPGSPVKTDLVLGRRPVASVDKAQRDGFGNGLTEKQNANIAGISDIESFKRLLKGLSDKVRWQHDAAAAIAAVVIQCRTGDGKRRSTGNKGDTWLMFVGPDQVGKRRMFTALAELMCNAAPVIINFGGGSRGEASTGLWGKTSLDRVSEAVKQNPFSVIVLEGIDQADALLHRKIKQAMETGRIPDSRGREVSLGNVIFVLNSNWVPEEASASQEASLQLEEKILDTADLPWRLELSVIDSNSSKHRADWSCEDGRPSKVAKDFSSGLGLSLDLNLSCGGGGDDTESSRNSSDLTVESEHDNRGQLAVRGMTSSPALELLELVDDAIVFRPVDFPAMRKAVLECILSKFEAIVGSRCSVRVDENSVDRLVGGLWVTGQEIDDWADKVLVPVLQQLRSRFRTDDGRSVVRLAAVGDKTAQRNRGTAEAMPATVTIVM